jgi:hypothetical protein
MKRWADRLPWWGAIAYVALAAYTLDRDPRIPRAAFQPYSVHNTGPAGCSLAHGYLAEGGRVETISRPLESSAIANDAVLFRIGPDTPVPPGLRAPAPEEVDEEESGEKKVSAPPTTKDAPRPPALLTPGEEGWVRDGGRIVIAVGDRYARLETAPQGEDETKKVFPLWAGVERLDPPHRRVLKGPPLSGVHAVFAADGGPVIARGRMGKGEVVLLSCPEIFQNGSLAKADHLVLLQSLAGGRPVVFDESVHGLSGEAGAVEILRQWGFGPALVLAVIASLASYWRGRSRLGPEEDDARETRIEAVDFVDSLAILYNRSLRRRQALAMYAKEFEQAVSARTGLHGAALQAKTREYLKTPPGPEGGPRERDLPVAEFQRKLRDINDAFGRLDHAKRAGDRRTGQGARRPA